MEDNADELVNLDTFLVELRRKVEAFEIYCRKVAEEEDTATLEQWWEVFETFE